MIATILTILLAWIAGPDDRGIVFEPANLIRCDANDTIQIAFPVGDSATLAFDDGFRRLDARAKGARLEGRRLRVGSIGAGRRHLVLRNFLGFRSLVVRVDELPPKRLDLVLRPTGTRPEVWTDSVSRAALAREMNRLLLGSGLEVRIQEESSIKLPPSPAFWDPEGDGHFDLLRNDDSLRPAPALDSLVGWLERHSVTFPNIIVFQSPVRVGWGLDSKVSAGDSTLVLANETTFPWRNSKLGIIRYVLQTPAGGSCDTFQVVGYDGNTMRIQTTSPDGKWQHAHSKDADIVLRPDLDSPAFGLSPSWRRGAAPMIIVPDAKRLDNSCQSARVILHEVCHTLGLHHRDEKQNVMSPVLRMDVETPVLLPDQAKTLHDRLTAGY
ncbi:MAG: matrixin family metalloprotease [Fibrobacterota bacterium]